MNPGRYPDLSNAEYHASAGISKSGLDQLAKSPAHYQAYLKAKQFGESADSKALRLGTAVHTLVLEPSKADFVTVNSRQTKEGKEKIVANPGKIVLTRDEFELSDAMADAIRSTEMPAALLDSPGAAEVSLYWNHPVGVLCKCRPDYLTDDGYIVDIKTAEDASPSGFERSAENYRYYVQAAFYRQGVEAALGLTVKGFIFVAVEKTPPYLVACYDATDSMLIDGDLEVTRLLHIYKDCLEKNEWPGYPEGLIPLSRPRWAA